MIVQILTREKMIEELVDNKLIQRQIAEKYNISEAWVSKLIKQYGLKKIPDDYYIGKTFGYLTVKARRGKDNHSHPVYLCECVCGNTTETRGYLLRQLDTISCGCKSRKRGKEHANYKGYEEISNTMWISIKNGAKQRNKEFLITIEEAWDKFIKQDRKCAISGLELTFAKTRKKTSDTTASLDRIDSKGGYTKDNIQWVYKKINTMKWDLEQKEFIELCNTIAEYQKGKSND